MEYCTCGWSETFTGKDWEGDSVIRCTNCGLPKTPERNPPVEQASDPKPNATAAGEADEKT